MSGPDLSARFSEAGGRRWLSPQPNLSGLGIIASYTARFWAAVVVLGVVTGVGSSAFVELLHLIERLAYGRRGGTLLADVSHAPGWRHMVVLLGAAVVVVVGLRLLGRFPTGGTEVTEAIWLRSGRLEWRSAVARGVMATVLVGMGASLGREAAPQAFGAATASWFAEWAALPTWQRRLLVAAGAGSGFAAIYNVPLGGTLLALEVMLGTLALPLVLPALLMSVTATAVAWIFLGTAPQYQVPSYGFHPTELVFAVLMGPVVGVAAVGWTRLISAAHRARPKAAGRWLVPFAAFGALGLLSLHYPQLLGNGRDIIQLTIVANLSIGLLFVLFALKPLVTAACLASGAPGGVFTPTLAVGVLLAGFCGAIWSHIWPGATTGSLALIGGGAFIAAAMQGPLAGIVLVLELTRTVDALMVPTIVAVVEATILARRLGAASTYSARLGTGALSGLPATGNPPVVAALQALDDDRSAP